MRTCCYGWAILVLALWMPRPAFGQSDNTPAGDALDDHDDPSPRADDIVIVMDASGSMWGEVDGQDKIAIAREVLGDLVTDWPAEHRLGLVAYGHRRKGDCRDIETLMDVAPVEAARIEQTVEGISPKGKTPLTAAVEHAADLLGYTEERASVVLLSESCCSPTASRPAIGTPARPPSGLSAPGSISLRTWLASMLSASVIGRSCDALPRTRADASCRQPRLASYARL